MPTGYCEFRLLVPPRAYAADMFKEWGVSSHGCPSDVLPSILKEGQLLMPGDLLIDGTTWPNRTTVSGKTIGWERRFGQVAI